MQHSWRQDPDKLTFIVCLPTTTTTGDTQHLSDTADTADRMIGDINLFLRVDDGEEGTSEPQVIGEVELMIAEKKNQRKGFGKATLLTFLRYVVDHESEILDEFVRGDEAASGALAKVVPGESGWKFSCLSVKIGQGNGRSLALFEGALFRKVSDEPSYFGEFELRRVELGRESVDKGLERAGVRNYVELWYGRSQ
jgi:DNA polymerase delta subunit 2